MSAWRNPPQHPVNEFKSPTKLIRGLIKGIEGDGGLALRIPWK
jgi:hypothetical protein